MNFSQKIRRICKEEGLNLKQFSDLTSIPYNSIRRYASDKRSPTWEQIHKIANTPRFEKYQQFLLSTEPDLIYSTKNETGNEEFHVMEVKIRDYYTSGTEQEKQELLQAMKEVMERQRNLEK